MSNLKTTGEFAKQVGVSGTTIRKYVRNGLVKPDVALPSGHMKFSQETIDNFIKNLKCKGENKNE